jgi:oligoendopeptidase F
MASKTKSKSLPPRSKVKPADQWNLSSLFKSDGEWERAFQKWEKQIPGYEKFKGHLGDSAEMLAAALRFDAAVDRQGERLGVYAYLKTTEDQANSDYQRMKGRYQHAATLAAEASSWMRPEMLAIPPKKMAAFLRARELGEW